MTEQQKKDKKELENLDRFSKSLRVAHNMGQIKTFRDLLINAGYNQSNLAPYFPAELNRPVSFQDLQNWLSDRRIELTTSHWLRDNPPPPSHDIEFDIRDEKPAVLDLQIIQNGENSPRLVRKLAPSIEDKYSEDNNYGFDRYAKAFEELPDTFLFWFQKKAVAQMLDNVLIHRYRSNLLLGQAGCGKTFMFGAFLFYLKKNRFAQEVLQSVSPWPYLVVTKATLVTKTKRDLERYFKLKCPRDVQVINIEQLRSEFGKLFVKERIEIIDGEEEISWQWEPGIYPAVVIWDECQVLKNSTSIQHKIGLSYSELPNTVQVFSSATPFTRVCEAKCFCIATRHKVSVP